jgi:hypothetical protein
VEGEMVRHLKLLPRIVVVLTLVVKITITRR